MLDLSLLAPDCYHFKKTLHARIARFVDLSDTSQTLHRWTLSVYWNSCDCGFAKMEMSLKNLRIKSPSVNCPLTGSWPFMENVHCSSFSSNSFNELDLYVLSEICF